jgi:hypothetical protein
MSRAKHGGKHPLATTNHSLPSEPQGKSVSLDQRLIYDARARTSGANVHRMKELIFAYELAVSLHNDGFLEHKTPSYDPTCEIELRKAVLKSRLEEFDCQYARAARNILEILKFLEPRSQEKSFVQS